MGSWQQRFESVFAEIEDSISLLELREQNLKKIYIESMWDNFRDLSSSYREELISQEAFDVGLVQLLNYNNNIDDSIRMVNFYEDLPL